MGIIWYMCSVGTRFVALQQVLPIWSPRANDYGCSPAHSPFKGRYGLIMLTGGSPLGLFRRANVDNICGFSVCVCFGDS